MEYFQRTIEATSECGRKAVIKFVNDEAFNKWRDDTIDQDLGITISSVAKPFDQIFYFATIEQKDEWIKQNLKK
jgi:hypothetical protein